MKKLVRVLDLMEKSLLFICGVLTAVMVICICYQVGLRYIFHSANTWADELARYSMEWIVMFGAPVAFRRHRHTRVDLVIEKIPESFRRYLQLVLYCLILVFVFQLGINGLGLAENGRNQLSPGLHIPMKFMYASQVIGPIFMAIFLLECVARECLVPIYYSFKGGKA